MNALARLLMNPYRYSVDSTENARIERSRKKARTARKKAQNHKRRRK